MAKKLNRPIIVGKNVVLTLASLLLATACGGTKRLSGNSQAPNPKPSPTAVADVAGATPSPLPSPSPSEEPVKGRSSTSTDTAVNIGPTPTPKSPTAQPARPIIALLDVVHDNANLITQLQANTGYAAVYRKKVTVRPGDILRVRGQIEMTNDVDAPASGTIQLVADGKPFGTQMTENALKDGSHHMPLWADGIVKVTQAQEMTLEVRLASSASGGPVVKVESPNMGHLVIEHYREFASTGEVREAGARYLLSARADLEADASQFGTVPVTKAYSLKETNEPGDIVRLFSQVVAKYAGSLQMHGQALSLGQDGALVSPFATQNARDFDPFVPLWSDGVHAPTAAGEQEYVVRLHGAFGTPALIVPGWGFLHSMHFRKVTNAVPPEGKFLTEASEILGPKDDTALAASGEYHNVISTPVSAKNGETLRLIANLNFAHPRGFGGALQCSSRIVMLSSDGKTVRESAFTSRNSFVAAELLPLRNELLYTATTDESLTLKLQIGCGRADALPHIVLYGGRTMLYLDRFAPMN